MTLEFQYVGAIRIAIKPLCSSLPHALGGNRATLILRDADARSERHWIPAKGPRE
jgi:hypothetical protein